MLTDGVFAERPFFTESLLLVVSLDSGGEKQTASGLIQGGNSPKSCTLGISWGTEQVHMSALTD